MMKETTPNITQNKTVQVDEIKPYVVQKLMWKNGMVWSDCHLTPDWLFSILHNTYLRCLLFSQ